MISKNGGQFITHEFLHMSRAPKYQSLSSTFPFTVVIQSILTFFMPVEDRIHIFFLKREDNNLSCRFGFYILCTILLFFGKAEIENSIKIVHLIGHSKLSNLF